MTKPWAVAITGASGVIHGVELLKALAELVARAAGVPLKERRPLVLMVLETPLPTGHWELMARAGRLGAAILPPVPAFSNHSSTIRDMIMQSVVKAWDLVGVELQLFARWPAVGS